jgi:hypothetical protein
VVASSVRAGHDVESEIETLLHQISDGRFADDRRHAMAQLKDILHDNPLVRRAAGPQRLQLSGWRSRRLPPAHLLPALPLPSRARPRPSSCTPTPLQPLPAQGQLAMGSMGLPVLVSVIQEDRDDLQLLTGALEVLIATFAAEEPTYGAPQHPEGQVGGGDAWPRPAGWPRCQGCQG